MEKPIGPMIYTVQKGAGGLWLGRILCWLGWHDTARDIVSVGPYRCMRPGCTYVESGG